MHFFSRLLLIITFLPVSAFAQKLHADIFGGVSNYQGDMQVKKYTFENTNAGFGAGLSYDLTSHVILRVHGLYTRLEGSDSTTTSAKKGFNDRNLSFRTKILEGQVAAEYNIFSMDESNFTPYVFAGLALFHFNPYTLFPDGTKAFLRPLGTEGQALDAYPEKKIYKNTQVSIPFGGGIKYRITDNIQLGVEIGLRKSFTDYLDDVSGTYADSTILATQGSPLAARLAYRGNEAGLGTYPGGGQIRGNAKAKDWYYMTVFRMSYLLGNGQSRGRSKTGCPTNVY